MDRFKNSIIHSSTKEYQVFSPSERELEQIIPEGNKVKIRRLDMYEWAFGTKRFTFVKDKSGDVYAKSRQGTVLFDDFISTHSSIYY